jgi:hypothetical protein
LALPGTNAEAERIFSVINALWTDEKNKFRIETIKAIIVVKTHFQDVSCTDFYNLRQQNTKLLTDIQSSAKYQPGAPDTSKEPQEDSHSLVAHPLYKTGTLCVCVRARALR